MLLISACHRYVSDALFQFIPAVTGGDAVRAVTPGAALRPDHLLHEARVANILVRVPCGLYFIPLMGLHDAPSATPLPYSLKTGYCCRKDLLIKTLLTGFDKDVPSSV